MLDTIQQLDTDIFLALNGSHCAWLDSFMWCFSGKIVWAGLYLAILYALKLRYGWRRTAGILVLIALIITVSDQLCGHWVRYTLERLRPSNPANPISPLVHIVNGYRGGPYGFPSCHAANSFALAMIVSLLFRVRKVTLLMFGWAVVTAWSRIVLGVHYPGDLLVGACVGVLASLCAWYTGRAVYRRYFTRLSAEPVNVLPRVTVWLIGTALAVTVAGMAIAATLF